MPDRLSKDFRVAEFACPCGCGFDQVDAALVYGLQRLRGRLGRPVVVLSGCRCEAHNQAAGGARRSQHVQGRAADVRVTGMTARELYAIAREVPQLRGFGVDDERGFLHVDTRDVGSRWCYRNGRQAAWHE